MAEKISRDVRRMSVIDLLDKDEIRLIRSTVLFRDMSDENFIRALSLFDAEAAFYEKGEYPHTPFGKHEKFGLVISGTVQVCSDDIDGNRMIMAEVTPGITFGESLCFLGISDSPVCVFASESTRVLWLSPDKLFEPGSDEFCVKLSKRFTSMLAARTLAMNGRIQVLSKIKLRDKLMTYFNQKSRDAGSLTFCIPVNREDMAAYMGTDRSALSRELSAMKKEGLIDYYKNTFRILK